MHFTTDTGNNSLDTEVKSKSSLNERRGVMGGWRVVVVVVRGGDGWGGVMGGNHSSRHTHILNV